RHAGVERVDANIELVRAGSALQHVERQSARLRLLVGDDGILEVDDQRVGLAFAGLLEFARGIARHEQHRTHQTGLLCIIAIRRHLPTISSFWFKAWCSNSTMPAFGRDLDSLNESTFVVARKVSPWKTGFGNVTSVMPRLATVVPMVVS